MFKDGQGDGIYEEIVKKLLLFGCVLIALFVLFLTIIAISLNGTQFIILGIGGIIFFVSLSFICWAPSKTKKYLIPLIISALPLYLLLPGKGKHEPGAPLEYRTVFESSSQWFSGISEHDLVSMGEKWGYTENERERLGENGGLASDYAELNTAKLYQYNASVVLDSWFFDRGHYWFYRPNSNKSPLLIFLHGSGGSFKPYQHWFVPYAQKHQIAMAFPTWGMGTWNSKQLAKRINEVIDDIKSNYSFNDRKIFICGLSQGSLTGLKTISSIKHKIAGFISISGMPFLNSSEVQTLSEIPLLVFHGSKDERVSAGNAATMISKIKQQNGSVDYQEFLDQDHTLIKVKTKEILELIFEWILVTNE